MASSTAPPGPPAPNNPAAARDLSFFEYLELRMDARRRQCRPAVVLLPNMLIETKCCQCDRLDAPGPARAAMTPRQRRYSIDDRSSRLQWHLGDVRPSDLAASMAITVPRIVPGEPHPALDVLATRAVCVSCVRMIYLKTRRLQEAVSGNGDTALHCTARAGNLRMVCHLITLAGEEATGDGYEAAKAAVRRQNARGETVLHEAVRFGRYDMVELLMWMDPQLARFPDQGASPMYLAVSLRHESIAELLYCKSGGNLSWSGPEGKNVLHAAVFLNDGRKEYLFWLRHGNKRKQTTNSTPRCGCRKPSPPPSITFRFSSHQGPLKRILDAHPTSARIADNNGSFPIHVAASTGSIKALQILIAVDLNSTGLRDGEGRTFLHVAVQNKRDNIVEFVCQEQILAWVLNMQDNDGNTALHLAVLIGELRIFSYLMQNKQVLVSLQNYNEQTALDISFRSRTTGLSYGMDPRVSIHRILVHVGARHGNYRQDQFEEEHIPKLDEEKEAKKITESTQALGIGAVLVATATFAAAFTMPGGYRADDHANGGVPTRAGNYGFDAFVVSNALAFTLSCIATTLLVLSGAAAVDTRTRQACLCFSVAFLMGAARSLCVAFALGMYVVLAPVALATAIAACLITSFTLLDVTLFVRVFFTEARTLYRRLGIEAWWTLGKMIVRNLLSEFWCYIVIFGLPAVLKLQRN